MRILPLLLLPFLELWLMIVIGSEVGALAVIAWLVAMILVGVNLLRYLGASNMMKAAQNARSGVMPVQSLGDGLFKAIGAVLLIIPGFITDFLALLCFIPLVRRLLLARWMANVAVRAREFQASGFRAGPFQSGQSGPFGSSTGNVYEHQGSEHSHPEQPHADQPHIGVIIDQEPESSSSQEPKDGSK